MGRSSVRCETAQEGVCDDSATTLAILLSAGTFAV